MPNGWTQERRARQAALIRRWRPWERSTGPKSTIGKNQASKNAYKGGTRTLLRSIRKALNVQDKERESFAEYASNNSD